MVSKLYTSHQAGDKNMGFDIEGEGAAVKDVAAAGIWDLYLAKMWGLKLATNAAATVLRVDQVEMVWVCSVGKKKHDHVFFIYCGLCNQVGSVTSICSLV